MNDLFYRSSRRKKSPVARSTGRSGGTKARFSFKFKNWKLFFGGLAAVCIVLLIGQTFKLALDSIQDSRIEELAEVYVVVGDVQRKKTDSTDFTPVYNVETVWEQDTVRTLSDSRAVVKLFDGTVVRLDESTSVSFEKLSQDGNDNVIDVKVDTGNVWVNTPQVLVGNTDLNVKTKYTNSTFNNSVVSLTSNLPEYVRVISGLATVDILDINGAKIDSTTIDSGNQLELSNASLEQLQSGSGSANIDGIDNRFSFSKWYEWNLEEDKNSSFGDDNSLIDPSETVDESVAPVLFDSDLNSEFIQTTDDGVDPAIQPIVESPKNGALIDDTDLVEITGTVPVNTAQVMVISYEEGDDKPNPYVLRGFKEGDSTFLYRAKYEPVYGNLNEGSNRFEVVAIDSRGQESPATEISFDFKAPVVKEEPVVETTNDKIQSIEVDESLDAPIILSINDVGFDNGFTLDEEKGVIEGSIGKWADKVVINNWTLQYYEPGTGSFRYILSPKFENVVDGKNVLKIYGVSSDGKRGPVATFEIIYDYEEI